MDLRINLLALFVGVTKQFYKRNRIREGGNPDVTPPKYM